MHLNSDEEHIVHLDKLCSMLSLKFSTKTVNGSLIHPRALLFMPLQPTMKVITLAFKTENQACCRKMHSSQFLYQAHLNLVS